ncbi:hypothetical protein Adu01nite_17300 [Paractinoplanes durhamensis]|uniref:SHOCT domain-containing protein n=2 Tax=Paractinoplanes durhamensis TaxID=113563 RepID=A0ABQ3YS07_9ACTN|nr:hypothetical protein Adu01nite_17300 [Actinoplanes durhamensis]
MFFLIIFSAIVITVLAISAWTWPELAQEAQDAKKEPKPEADAKSKSEPEAAPPSLEGVLVTQLMAGQISAGQYRRAVEGLAARDDDRHPMAVPPENA